MLRIQYHIAGQTAPFLSLGMTLPLSLTGTESMSLFTHFSNSNLNISGTNALDQTDTPSTPQLTHNQHLIHVSLDSRFRVNYFLTLFDS